MKILNVIGESFTTISTTIGMTVLIIGGALYLNVNCTQNPDESYSCSNK